MTEINKHYIARLYRLHSALHRGIEQIIPEYAIDDDYWGLTMICNELEAVFAETLTEAERAEASDVE
jgi:hypothetical protein